MIKHQIEGHIYNQLKILLGKRKNDPLKGFFFTPGGRVLKNDVRVGNVTSLVKKFFIISH